MNSNADSPNVAYNVGTMKKRFVPDDCRYLIELVMNVMFSHQQTWMVIPCDVGLSRISRSIIRLALPCLALQVVIGVGVGFNFQGKKEVGAAPPMLFDQRPLRTF